MVLETVSVDDHIIMGELLVSAHITITASEYTVCSSMGQVIVLAFNGDCSWISLSIFVMLHNTITVAATIVLSYHLKIEPFIGNELTCVFLSYSPSNTIIPQREERHLISNSFVTVSRPKLLRLT